MTPPALALVRPAPARLDRLAPLRRRFARAGGATTEAVLVDFTEDDLAEAGDALDAVGTWLERVESTLRDVRSGGEDLVDLARACEAVEQAEELGETLAALRRRLLSLAARMPAPRRPGAA